MGAPETILKLCETFSAHKEHYKSANYNETELRREFLDPFFKALGWDVDNEAGYADAYKDVIHERQELRDRVARHAKNDVDTSWLDGADQLQAASADLLTAMQYLPR